MIKTEAYSEHRKTFKRERFAKRTPAECKYGTRHFSRQGSVVGVRVGWRD